MLKPLLLAVLFLLLSLSVYPYYGIHSTESLLTFEAAIELPIGDQVEDIQEIQRDSELYEYVLAEIQDQYTYLQGSFTSESFEKKTKGLSATIGPEFNIKLLELYEGFEEDHSIIRYQLSGVVLVHRGFFGKNGQNQTGQIPITLPLNPETIYSKGMGKVKVSEYVNGKIKKKEKNQEKSFWYGRSTASYYI